MTKLSRRLFTPPRTPKLDALQGSPGYDNPRENIDPHVKTKVLSTNEGVFKRIDVRNTGEIHIGGNAGRNIEVEGDNATAFIDLKTDLSADFHSRIEQETAGDMHIYTDGNPDQLRLLNGNGIEISGSVLVKSGANVVDDLVIHNHDGGQSGALVPHDVYVAPSFNIDTVYENARDRPIMIYGTCKCKITGLGTGRKAWYACKTDSDVTPATAVQWGGFPATTPPANSIGHFPFCFVVQPGDNWRIQSFATDGTVELVKINYVVI